MTAIKSKPLYFYQSRDIKDYRVLIDTLIPDFGHAFLHTLLQWCELANDSNGDQGQFWQVWLINKRRSAGSTVMHSRDMPTIGICGLYTLHPHDTKQLWLGWLGIIPDIRNKGYGKHVMQHLYTKAGEHGCKEIMVYVDKEGRPLSFYEREGFEMLGTVKEYLSDNKMQKIDGNGFESPDDYVLRKRLV